MSDRREFLRQVAGLGVGAALEWGLGSRGSGFQATDQGRPNILLILMDDLRWNALGCMGNPSVPTPNIDRLAHEGVRFSNAFVTTSLCSPSRASFLTGVYAHRHGVLGNDMNDPDPNYPTFPQLLQRMGYATAYIGKWHMEPHIQPRPGFDYWLGSRWNNYYTIPLNENGREFQVQGYRTDVLTDYAVRWLLKPRTKPFCLYLAHLAVHSPYTPAERHQQSLSNLWLPEPRSFNETLENKPAWLRAAVAQNLGLEEELADQEELATPWLPPQEWNPRLPMWLDYFRTLLAADEGVGRLLTTLENLGQLDSTVIVFTSDNGFLMGEHRRVGKQLMYEESIRIPLLVRYPPLVQPRRVLEEMVLNIDLAPTLLELAGMQVPPTMQGRSLVPLLAGQPGPWRRSFLYEYFRDERFPIPTMLGVRTERAKYITYPGLQDIDELYDLEQDPFELSNLALEPAARLQRAEMRQELQRLLRETDYHGPGLAEGNGAAEIKPVAAQLHLHGWSNHAASPYPASMQWQAHQAAASQTPVLWWTEHGRMFDQTEDTVISARGGYVDPHTLRVTGLVSSPITSLEAQVDGGKAEARVVGSALEMSLTSAKDADDFQSFTYWTRGQTDSLEALSFARPLAAEVELTCDLEVPALSPDTQVLILVKLAAHFQDQPRIHTLTYQVVEPGTVKAPEVGEESRVLAAAPLRRNGTQVRLNLLEEARLLPHGVDNTLSELGFQIRARRGATVKARWQSFRLHSQQAQVRLLLERLEEQVEVCQRQYGVTGFVGVEYGDEGPHLSGFVLPQAVSPELMWPAPTDPAEFVQLVHDLGGLVAYNHPFGLTGPRPETVAVASQLLRNRLYGADLLEVGTLARAGMDLRPNLDLWDLLLANRLFLCGTGVSATHGGVWGPDMASPFVSWLWSVDQDPANLLLALRQRRVFWGNPFLFQGSLDLTLWTGDERQEYGRMGEVVDVPESQAQLQIHLPMAGKGEVYLYQGYLRPGRSVVYAVKGEAVEPERKVPLNTSWPCFVRVEVWQGKTPLVFSNPIIIRKQK